MVFILLLTKFKKIDINNKIKIKIKDLNTKTCSAVWQQLQQTVFCQRART